MRKQCEIPIPGGRAVEDNVLIGVTLTWKYQLSHKDGCLEQLTPQTGHNQGPQSNSRHTPITFLYIAKIVSLSNTHWGEI